MRQQFLKGKTDTIRITAFDKNRPLIPSSALITLYTPTGGTLQAQASATVNSTTGEMTYSLTATHTVNGGISFKADWEYVVSGTTYYQTQLFDVVKSILSIPIIDEDLYNELESLRATNRQLTGTATSATASTLVDTTNRKESDNHWKGGTIEIIAGTGVNQRRAISSSTQSTGTISVTPDWVTTPSTDSVYRIVRSYYYKIEEGFKEVETLLYNKGQRHQLILESSQIEIPLKYLVLHKICKDLMDEEDDKWDRLQKDYWEKFNLAFNGMALDYDADDSGFIQGDEKQRGVGAFYIGRS